MQRQHIILHGVHLRRMHRLILLVALLHTWAGCGAISKEHLLVSKVLPIFRTSYYFCAYSDLSLLHELLISLMILKLEAFRLGPLPELSRIDKRFAYLAEPLRYN
ncbi:MAG: hypothetical protein EBZ48_11470 [Proteobacteria bacterium]|nr:hypothetical protein [Pseudomonadota bacterium]